MTLSFIPKLLVTIAKHEAGIRYRTLRRLFKLVQQLESKELRKIRKSILGVSWVLPKTLLFNPLLHLQDLSNENSFVNHYPIVCMDREGEGYFVLTNRIFCEQFAEYVADWCQPYLKCLPRPVFPCDDTNGGEVSRSLWTDSDY